ncbi:MAG TPA: hypothetical protein VGQ24_10605 [Gemmatimonadales bacterium]|jgi:hypothetical protein|nr:hypothetical protein [Gemmatimonadales bacterium]
MPNNLDFRVEILQYKPGAPGPLPAPLDVTEHAKLDGLGSINRAVERDLLSFKTGDATLKFRNVRAFFDDLFAFFGPTDRWQLRLFRRNEIQFWGILLGAGSIKFDRKAREVEITAYGLTRHLQDTSAEGVQRTFAAAIYPTAGINPGNTTLTLNDTTGILPGDTLHITSETAAEDYVVKRVISAMSVEIEAGSVNGYGGGTPPANLSIITVATPYYRYRGIEFLVRALFAAATIPVAEYRLSGSAFKYPAPAPVNPQGLVVNQFQGAAAQEANGRCYITVNDTGTYYQVNPEDAWVLEDGTERAWVDWSRYFRQGHAQPVILLRAPTGIGGGNLSEGYGDGWDFNGGAGSTPLTGYYIDELAEPEKISKKTTSDGITWGATTGVVDLPDSGTKELSTQTSRGLEFDPVRNALYCWWEYDDGSRYSQYYDIAGGTFTSLLQGEDVDGSHYAGFIYIPEYDYALCLRSIPSTGPVFEICAFRGTTRLWKRPFPRCLVRSESSVEGYIYPTRSIRYLNGFLVGLISHDQGIQFVRTGDEFLTYRANKIVDGSINTRLHGGRVKEQYRIFSYKGGNPGAGRNWMVASQQLAGVIDYADFGGKSVAEALRDLATLVNAVFWIDDEGAGHFVARDLFDAGNVIDITDRIKERTDDLLWENVAQYVEVSATIGSTAIAGDKNFSSSGVSLSSPFIPNAAYAQAIADSFIDFYNKKRALIETTVKDSDGRIYRPLDRVMIDGARWMVYESDHDLGAEEVSVKFLEDAA